jgi:hypothetical protein
MRIEFAHLRELSTNGRYVDFAVFDAKSNNNTEAERTTLLTQLTLAAAHALDLKIDAAGLAYVENGQLKYWGHPFVIDFLKKRGVPRPTHYLDL